MILYFDASALVKLVVEEEGSVLAARLWDGCDAAVSSRLAYVEVRAALAAAARNNELTAADLATAEAGWEELWAAVRPVELTGEVTRHAGRLAGEHRLRGADAVHLASALALAEADADVAMAVWDRRLSAGAEAVRLPVTPPGLEPLAGVGP